jgi:hypothetical protein
MIGVGTVTAHADPLHALSGFRTHAVPSQVLTGFCTHAVPLQTFTRLLGAAGVRVGMNTGRGGSLNAGRNIPGID